MKVSLYILIFICCQGYTICANAEAEDVGQTNSATDFIAGSLKDAKIDAKATQEKYETFEVITDEDRKAAQQALFSEVLVYAGYTLLVVAFSVFAITCFLMDPRACLVAFSTGSPCCLICPCYRSLMKYTDPSKLIKANVNIYVPGVYVEESGRLRQYPPTPQEMECMYDLVSEFLEM